MQYSEDQEKALAAMLDWYKNRDPSDPKQQVFYLAGWAGTGKTTIANAFRESLPKEARVRYASFTGKAALRMRQAGMKSASTLHSLIYTVDTDKKGKPIFHLDDKSPLKRAHLLVLDECSMVDAELGRDVISFKVPILILGDQGQLPPIKGQGFFTSRRPNMVLSQVHRQALDNPIIQLATNIRQGKSIIKFDDERLVTYAKEDYLREQFLSTNLKSSQILCGKNKTRNNINSYIREELKHLDSLPEKGEKIICLRNNMQDKVFNGLIGFLDKDTYEEHDILFMDFTDEEGLTYENLQVLEEGFVDETLLKDMAMYLRRRSNEFTFGYGITVHKSQGSQWDNVYIVDDNMLIWDKPNRRRWLYTAVTRAANRLVIGRYPKGGF